MTITAELLGELLGNFVKLRAIRLDHRTKDGRSRSNGKSMKSGNGGVRA
jgi:hypothetical protein